MIAIFVPLGLGKAYLNGSTAGQAVGEQRPAAKQRGAYRPLIPIFAIPESPTCDEILDDLTDRGVEP